MDGEAAASASACRRENSAGKVPLVLSLADADVAGSREKPPPFYVSAPRLACLPSLVDAALEFYRDSLTPGEDAPWFESGGTPLRNHVPIGVLADLASAPSTSPWPLTIHFRSFPADALVRWPGPHAAQAAFFNDLKEAACAVGGSAGGILGAPLPDRDGLWDAAQAGDADAAWTATSRMGLDDGKGGALPVRLFVAFGGGRPPAYASRPVPALPGQTLGEALFEALPAPPPDGGGADTASSARPWSLTAGGGLALRGTPVSAVLTCGVPAPLSAPAAWAHAALAACDRFLYVVVRV